MSAVATSSLIQPLRPALLFSVLAHLLLFLWVMDNELPRPVWSQPLPTESTISIQLQAYQAPAPVPSSTVNPVPPAPPPEVSKVVEPLPLPLPVIPEPATKVVPPAKPLSIIPPKPSKAVKTVNTEARTAIPPAPQPLKPAKVVPVPKVKQTTVKKTIKKEENKKVLVNKKPITKKTIAKKVAAKVSKPVSQERVQQPVKKVVKPRPKNPVVKVKTVPKPVPAATPNTAKKVTDKRFSKNVSGLEVAKKTTSPSASTAPLILSKPDYLQPPAQPRYPARSKRRGEQGTVWLRILLDSAGVIKNLMVKSSSGFDRLDKSALEAAAKWKFKPAVVDGSGRDAWLEVPVHFKLR
ncbi:MAG: TonB family protein [Motiliproteus sp.]|nr:TonB family protein [Motiliproteus sp.]MCW9050857.1 TonB family protein [Motiliproteus sp.]